MNKREQLRKMLHTTKLVLFDLDGTLVDSNDHHADAWAKVLNKHGHPFSAKTLRPWIGKGGDKILTELVGIDDQSAEGKAITKARSELFLESYAAQITAFPDAGNLLIALREKGFQVALASSAALEELKSVLSFANLEGSVPDFTTADDAEHSKPAPDIIQAALRKARMDPGSAVMVGDTPYDLTASAAAGVRSIAVRSGGWNDDSLKAADLIFDDVHDILNSLP